MTIARRLQGLDPAQTGRLAAFDPAQVGLGGGQHVFARKRLRSLVRVGSATPSPSGRGVCALSHVNPSGVAVCASERTPRSGAAYRSP